MRFSVLNDHHRKDARPPGASTKLPERGEFVSCGCRSTFRRNDCGAFYDKETSDSVIFELKARSLRRCTRKKHEEEESPVESAPETDGNN